MVEVMPTGGSPRTRGSRSPTDRGQKSGSGRRARAGGHDHDRAQTRSVFERYSIVRSEGDLKRAVEQLDEARGDNGPIRQLSAL